MHTISAAYSGDANFNPNTAPPFTQTVLEGPSATLSPSSLMFPVRRVGSPSPSKAITLTNTGNVTLTISSITITGASAGDFSQTNNCGSSVGAGASCTINVTFLPTAAGSRTAAVSVADNAPDSPQSAALSGTGTVVVLAPASLNFGAQQVGTRSPAKSVTLTNIGSSALNITSITLSGVNAADFFQTNNCGSSVAGGASCTIRVTFRPSATGARSASISITDDGGGSPQKVQLSGTGT